MCDQAKHRLDYVNSPPIGRVEDQATLRLHAQRLEETIKGNGNCPNHLNIVDRIVRQGIGPALVCDTGNPCGILTYRNGLGSAYIRELVVRPSLKGVARLLIGKLLFLAENNVVQTSPLYEDSKAAFKRLCFVEDGGHYKLDPNHQVIFKNFTWRENKSQEQWEFVAAG